MTMKHNFMPLMILGTSILLVSSFSHTSTTRFRVASIRDQLRLDETNIDYAPIPHINSKNDGALLKTLSMASLLCFMVTAQSINPVWADEYGRETEAPTFFTGENVMICTKRGPLGACLETTMRTSANDNDKASKYFGDPAAALKEKYRVAQLQQLDNQNSVDQDNSEGSQLLKRLKQQSIDNKDKNDKTVRQTTLQNDLGASYGPFDTQVVVINSDGDSYTLLTGPQATRLKQQGYLKGRRFVTQPTQEIIDAVAKADEGEGGFIGSLVQGIFGGGD